MNRNIGKTIKIGLAYLGVIVGAGFASGKELEQYYVSFGEMGFWGVLLSMALFAFTGLIVLQLGSFFNAKDHTKVLNEITHPIMSRILDVIITLTLFCIGFVMIAGAGSNLNQQFGLPVWVGSIVVSILIILTGLLDVDKVTTVIGSITPLIIIFFLFISIHSLITTDLAPEEAFGLAAQIPTTLPNWFISALNYVAFNFTTGVSMAILMGGDEYDPKQAGRGGLFGGVLIGVLLMLAFVALVSKVDIVAGDAMPMLSLVNAIHPILGVIMSVAILGMIFNTGIAMYYALAKRILAGRSQKNFMPVLITIVMIGLVFSSIGFEDLVAYVFPVVGYAGLILIGVLAYAWIKEKKNISKESSVRSRILSLTVKKMDKKETFNTTDRDALHREIQSSNMKEEEVKSDSEEIAQELLKKK